MHCMLPTFASFMGALEWLLNGRHPVLLQHLYHFEFKLLEFQIKIETTTEVDKSVGKNTGLPGPPRPR